MKTTRPFINFFLFFFILSLAYRIVLPAQAQDQNQIGLIVQFDDETINTFCISFTGDSLSGYDVLQKSGLNILAAFDPIGAAICKIENTGCPTDNCFCQSPPNYWSYWHLLNNQWEYSQRGATLAQLQSGAVEGWRWGDGQPPSVSYSIDEICVPATETPTPTETSTSTDTPTLTASPITHNDDEENNDNAPFTLYFDNSSGNGITPSPSRTPTPTISELSTSSPSVTTEPSATSLPNRSTATASPSVSPTLKIKATSLKATRIAKKTQDSLQKTRENISTPTSLPIPASTEMPTSNQTIPSSQALIKFLAVIVLLLVVGITGTLLLKKREQ